MTEVGDSASGASSKTSQDTGSRRAAGADAAAAEGPTDTRGSSLRCSVEEDGL